MAGKFSPVGEKDISSTIVAEFAAQFQEYVNSDCIIRTGVLPRVSHVPFTNRLFATWEENDKRYHSQAPVVLMINGEVFCLDEVKDRSLKRGDQVTLIPVIAGG